MGTQRFLFAVVLSASAMVYAQSDADRATAGLKWTQEAIDTNAVMRYFEPPARQSETRWQVVKMEDCRVELKQTWHRTSPDSVFIGHDMFGRTEEKTTIYAFDLHELRPSEIEADTSTGLPQVKIFAAGDLFHVTTDTVSSTTRADGTVADTLKWSVPSSGRNLWIYFDSPGADNKAVVRRVAAELQNAAGRCEAPRSSMPRRSPKMVVSAALRELHGNSK